MSSNSNQFGDYGDVGLQFDTPQKVVNAAKEDATYLNLSKWAQRIEKIGLVVLVLILIYGLYISFVSGIQRELTGYGIYSNYQTTFSFGIFISRFFAFAVYAIIDYCIYNVTALLISALAKIVYNTRLSALSSLGMYIKTSRESNEAE